MISKRLLDCLFVRHGDEVVNALVSRGESRWLETDRRHPCHLVTEIGFLTSCGAREKIRKKNSQVWWWPRQSLVCRQVKEKLNTDTISLRWRTAFTLCLPLVKSFPRGKTSLVDLGLTRQLGLPVVLSMRHWSDIPVVTFVKVGRTKNKHRNKQTKTQKKSSANWSMSS